MYLGPLVTCPIFFPDFNQSEFSRQISINVSIIRLRENPSSGSRISACGQADRRADMTKLIVAFRNCANAPKKSKIHLFRTLSARVIVIIICNSHQPNTVSLNLIKTHYHFCDCCLTVFIVASCSVRMVYLYKKKVCRLFLCCFKIVAS